MSSVKIMRRKNNLLLWGFLSSTVLLDQVSKHFAEVYFGYQSLILTPWLSFTLFHNTGCAWSLFQNHTMPLGVLGVVVLFFVYYARNILRIYEHPIAFGLLLGGILGNAIDRLFRGFVVDFIDINLQIYRWPTFNAADTALCIAAFILILFPSKREQNSAV
ncbi:MAG: signal peptidase II [Puniceicoccales bacterium]|jgi:signal peptidase II|nr:signal peptidase II [Puniceicoccales bacterium]